MILSLSGFLFDEYTHCELGFEEFLALAKSAGYDGVELRRTQVNPAMDDILLNDCRSLLDEYGLVVTCLTARGLPKSGTPRGRFFEAYLALAHRLGCRLLKINSDPPWLHQAAETAAQAGVTLATNTHLHTNNETVAGTLSFVEAVDHPNFALLYDCMHLAVAGEDYIGGLERLRPYIRNVLVQCVQPAREGQPVCLSYAGVDYEKTCIDDHPIQDWPAVLGELKRLKYDGPVTVIENAWPTDQRRDIAVRTANWLRQNFA